MPKFVDGGLSPGEEDALTQMISSITNLPSSWKAPNTSNACNWDGITCSTDGHIWMITLVNMNLTGTIPPQITQFDWMYRLMLSINSLSGTIPPGIGSMKNLLNLELDMNKLTGTIPVEIGNLAILDILALSANRLEGTIPNQIAKIPALISAKFDFNLLTGTIPSEFGTLPVLGLLDLTSNQLTGTIPQTWGPNLYSLALGSNNLVGPIPQSLVNLKSLATLLLSNNGGLTGCIPKGLGAAQNQNFDCDVSKTNLTCCTSRALCQTDKGYCSTFKSGKLSGWEVFFIVLVILVVVGFVGVLITRKILSARGIEAKTVIDKVNPFTKPKTYDQID